MWGCRCGRGRGRVCAGIISDIETHDSDLCDGRIHAFDVKPDAERDKEG